MTAARALWVAFGLVLVGACWIAGGLEPLGYLLPALLVVAPLLWGRYPGEQMLCCARRAQDGERPPADLPPPRPPARAPRGGRLIAFRFGGRGPPRAAIAA